jgi:hypothetical protein
MVFKLPKEFYERKEKEHELSKVTINGIDKYPEEIEDQSLSSENDIQANSWGQDALVTKWNDESLINKVKYYRNNSLPQRHYPCNTYDEALMYLLLPELLKRFERKAKLNSIIDKNFNGRKFNLKNIKSIKFGFENCDSMEIPIKYVAQLHLAQISNKQIDYELNNSSQRVSYSAKDFGIQIHSSFNKEENHALNDEGKPFDRIIKWPDIVDVTIIYEDESEEIYYLNWYYSDNENDEVYEENNLYQHHKESLFGELFIIVNSDEDWDILFPNGTEDWINDEDRFKSDWL